jgi:hypothetical protein
MLIALHTALGDGAIGASIKKRNHPMIAYYVPLSLNTDNLAYLAEILKANNIQEGDITKIRWAKLLARRAPNQICGHLIINFSGLDAANRAKTKGLLICNKRVLVSKYKKESIRCLKCHGWNHIATECTQALHRCGTCSVRGHHTNSCSNTNTYCVNCEKDDHTSWSRECPTLVKKCQEFDINTQKIASSTTCHQRLGHGQSPLSLHQRTRHTGQGRHHLL